MKTKKMFVGLGATLALGAAIVPMSSYAVSDNANVNVALNVGSTISMSLDSNNISQTILNNDEKTDKTTTAYVSTNSATGYKLSATTSSVDGALVDAGISRSIGYVGTDYNSEGEGWALSVGGVFKDIYGNEIRNLGSKNTPVDDDATVINYNFKTAGDTASGEYKTTLTYTATTQQ